jgi:hypothetical protein
MSGEVLTLLARAALKQAVSKSIRRIMRVRAEFTFDALMDELRAARLSPDDVASRDDLAAMMIALFTTMSLGAAATNLRILARIIAHKAEKPDRGADEFVLWADIVGGLQPEELQFIAMLFECFDRHGWEPEQGEHRDDIAVEFLKQVVGVSPQLRDDRDVQVVGNRLIALGLAEPIPTVSGGNRFMPTRRLFRLVKMARLSEFGPEFSQGFE